MYANIAQKSQKQFLDWQFRLYLRKAGPRLDPHCLKYDPDPPSGGKGNKTGYIYIYIYVTVNMRNQ